MNTIKKSAEAEIIEKKSKFIGEVFYIETVQEAEEKLREINKKYHDAKHHCFAYRVMEQEKIIEKCSDDGEPSGTAGAPMLQIISKNDLINVIVIVTRYFGGILLGTGGLVRAYSKATSDSLEKAEIVEIKKGERIEITISYKDLQFIKYYCTKNDIKIENTEFSEEPKVTIELTENQKERFLGETQKKQINIKKIQLIQKDIYFI